MELYVAPELAEQIIKISESFNVSAQVVGRVEKSNQKELTIKGPHEKFQYS
jgi:phosphoribosylformylglycinamidine cyclo-ligase